MSKISCPFSNSDKTMLGHTVSMYLILLFSLPYRVHPPPHTQTLSTAQLITHLSTPLHPLSPPPPSKQGRGTLLHPFSNANFPHSLFSGCPRGCGGGGGGGGGGLRAHAQEVSESLLSRQKTLYTPQLCLQVCI